MNPGLNQRWNVMPKLAVKTRILICGPSFANCFWWSLEFCRKLQGSYVVTAVVGGADFVESGVHQCGLRMIALYYCISTACRKTDELEGNPLQSWHTRFTREGGGGCIDLYGYCKAI